MKIDFQAVLIGFDGEPLRDTTTVIVTAPDGRLVERVVPTEKVITLGQVCCNALGNPTSDETQLTGDEKARRFTLAVAIFSAKELLDMKVEDVALVKALIGKLYGPLVVGPCYLLLES